MAISGKYIYGVIQTEQDQRFGPIGLQNEEVLTIGMGELAMLVSHYESEKEDKVRSSRRNLLAHQKVLEHVMKEYNLLPVKFGTMAAHEGEVRNLLLKHQKGFTQNLLRLDGMVELSVKVNWEDMRTVYDELLLENEAIQALKIDVAQNQHTGALIEVGKMVEAALVQKRLMESQPIFEELSRISVEAKQQKLIGDQMLLNGAFLVRKSREKDFDNTMDELGEQYEGRLTFKYVGPLAPYSFVDLSIYPETWEV